MFEQADRVRPGSCRQLTDKARRMTRAVISPPAVAGATSLVAAFRSGEIDLYVAYRTTADWLIGQVPWLAVTDPPAALAVEARLGLTLIKGARSEAGWLALYLLAPEGQRVLAESGFPPA
jgi:ABC-type molybdate transport system substrate-binding protein